MANKILRVIYNGLRFIGNPAYKNLLAVEPSTRISKSKNAILKIGKKFRSRYNVEIHARDCGVIEIGDGVFFNSGCIVTAREKITIGDNTILGPNVLIYDHDHQIKDGIVQDNQFDSSAVLIGKNVWIGAGTIILKGAKIGDYSVIAAGSIVKGVVAEKSVLVQKRNKTILPIRKE